MTDSNRASTERNSHLSSAIVLLHQNTTNDIRVVPEKKTFSTLNCVSNNVTFSNEILRLSIHSMYISREDAVLKLLPQTVESLSSLPPKDLLIVTIAHRGSPPGLSEGLPQASKSLGITSKVGSCPVLDGFPV